MMREIYGAMSEDMYENGEMQPRIARAKRRRSTNAEETIDELVESAKNSLESHSTAIAFDSEPLFVNDQHSSDARLLDSLWSTPSPSKKRRGGTDWDLMYAEAFSIEPKRVSSLK